MNLWRAMFTISHRFCDAIFSRISGYLRELSDHLIRICTPLRSKFFETHSVFNNSFSLRNYREIFRLYQIWGLQSWISDLEYPSLSMHGNALAEKYYSRFSLRKFLSKCRQTLFHKRALDWLQEIPKYLTVMRIRAKWKQTLPIYPSCLCYRADVRDSSFWLWEWGIIYLFILGSKRK